MATPIPVPRVMAVPLYTIEVRSATTASSATVVVFFSTGADSPVRVDSSQQRVLPCTSRMSAVTTSPLSSRTMSPGTICSAGRILSLPSRITREAREPSFLKASMDLTARSSVTNPIAVLMASTSRIAIASVHSPNSAAITAAVANSQTTGLLSCLGRMAGAVTRGCIRSVLGPWRFSRRAASCPVRPKPGSTCS
jgi:hypothetical protein